MSNRSERAKRRAARVRNQRIAIIVIAVLVLAVSAFFVVRAFTGQTSSAPTSGGSPAAGSGNTITTASGLQYQDLVVGDGAEAKAGDTVSVHYVGTLQDGTQFDSSVDRGEPFTFSLGAGQVIRGWDEGVAGMKVGGKRLLIIPPDLGYGAQGAGGVIPPNAVLVFQVELLDIPTP